MRRSSLLLIALLTLILLSACSPEEGRYSATLIMDGDHTITTDDASSGGWVVTGGRVRLEEGSHLKGSVYVLGGSVRVNGEVDGDVSIIGGEVTLGPRATVVGDLDIGGGKLNRSPAATVAGEVSADTGPGIQVPLFPEWTLIPVSEKSSILERVVTLVLNTAVVAALAFLLVRFLPQPVSRVAGAVTKAPVVAGALGLLTLIVVPSLLVLMAFTIILVPVALLGALLLGVLVLYGWVAIGSEIGRRLVRWRNWEVSQATTALLGTLVLVLLVGTSGFVPVVRTVVPILTAAVGVGAVFLTRFGTRFFTPSTGEA